MKIYFPSNLEIEDAILSSMEVLGGTATTEQINQKVIEILDLSEEVVQLEDESGLGTKLSYRLRWCRTNLKSKGKIKNVKRGTWTINN